MHGAELDFVFSRAPNTADDSEPEALADLLVGYWANFARTGNPNQGLARPRSSPPPRLFSTVAGQPLHWPRTFGTSYTPPLAPGANIDEVLGDTELHVSPQYNAP